MLTLSKFEGKTLEEVKENCLNELNVTEDKIFFKQSETEAKLFKSKKIILEAIKKHDIIDTFIIVFICCSCSLFIDAVWFSLNEKNVAAHTNIGNIRYNQCPDLNAVKGLVPNWNPKKFSSKITGNLFNAS